MKRFLVTHQAETDLAEIWDHIAQRSEQAADRVMDTVHVTCRTLADFASLGEACVGIGLGLRNMPVGNYVIYYRPIENGVEIMRVIHGARDLGNLFEPPSDD